MAAMSAIPPDVVTVHTADNVYIGYSTAGLGSRMIAQLVDNLIAILLAGAGLAVYLAVVSGGSTTSQGTLFGALGAAVFASFVYFAYFLVCEAVSGGRTPGKAALGLRVLRLDGAAPDFLAILIRNLFRVIDTLFGIGILVMFFNPLSRRLGDLVAGTVVVREKARVTYAAAVTPPPMILRTPDSGPPIEGVQRLGAVEHSALRTFLSRQGLAPELRTRLAADIAARMLERLGLAPSAPERMWPPELLLERLYLQLDTRMR
jgi:uncharacterized RDD family membrane protein YckC